MYQFNSKIFTKQRETYSNLVVSPADFEIVFVYRDAFIFTILF